MSLNQKVIQPFFFEMSCCAVHAAGPIQCLDPLGNQMSQKVIQPFLFEISCCAVHAAGSNKCCAVLQVQFNGMTPLGTSLNQKVIQPFLFNGIQQRILQKPILVIIITDGEPTGEPQNTVAQTIKNAKNMTMNSPYGPGAIAFEFAQVRQLTCNAYILHIEATLNCRWPRLMRMPQTNLQTPQMALDLLQFAFAQVRQSQLRCSAT